ncbi:MAG: hypothetical protein AAEJ65_01300 [Planctomycetota bacterium]
MGRHREELSLFELLKEQGRSGDQDAREGQTESSTESRIPGDPQAESAGGTRRKVALDDRAKQIPPVRRLPPIHGGASSEAGASYPLTSSPRVSFFSERIEIRISTILVFSIAALVAIAVAFISGRQFSVAVPEGRTEMVRQDPLWPVLDPEPEPRPAIRNVKQDGVVDVSDPGVVAEEVAVIPVMVEALPKTLWAVMIGQHLSKDPQVIDQLVQYVDSGLSFSTARIRVSNSRGVRTFSVFVGPFDQQDQARSALREIQSLRPHLGVRFRDAYPTRMVFDPEELERYGIGN